MPGTILLGTTSELLLLRLLYSWPSYENAGIFINANYPFSLQCRSYERNIAYRIRQKVNPVILMPKLI